jgi:hypothetical protein
MKDKSSTFTIGIDLGDRKHAVCVLDAKGEILKQESRTKHDRIPSTNRSPIVIEVPPARIPEEPVAVIPHAGICKGGVGQPASLP